MQTKRTTNIKFESKLDMTNAMYELGICIRSMKKSENYVDPIDKNELDYCDMRLLEKHGIKCERVICWSTIVNNWDTLYKIRDQFKTDMNVYIWTITLECVTYNKDAETHREEVMKLYNPIKALGYNVTHSCETEITEDNC